MKVKKPQREKRKFWKQMIDHIDFTWKKRKDSDMGYPFTGKDMADLRHFSGPFKEWGIMSLWDIYIEQDNEFNRKTGWSVFQFTRSLPFLVDIPGWKDKARRYEALLIPPLPKEVAELFSKDQFVVKKAVKT